MNSVSFYGNESCGSIGERINTAKQECAGSIGVRAVTPEVNLEGPDKDTVSFRGANESKEKKSSAGKTLFKLIATAGLIVGGLGLAHKYDTVNKIFKGNGRVQDFLKKNASKVTEPCYNLCLATKEKSAALYKKVAGWLKPNK